MTSSKKTSSPDCPKQPCERRLIEVVRAAADGKSDRQASADLGMGVNYVGQLLAGKTAIRLPTFVRLLERLGAANAIYILFGYRADDDETTEIIQTALSIQDPKVREAVLEHLRRVRSFSSPPEHRDETPD